ncbi:MAG: ParA family partition ATPase [Alphaproteobacteria bacterium]
MAGIIIAAAQQKGGAGKTTLMTQLAVYWSLQGKKVAVVDIDPQGSMSQWFEQRKLLTAEPGNKTIPSTITHSQVTGWRTENEVKKLTERHDVVLIDSAPHALIESRIAVRAAHLILVPVQPSPMDLWATEPTVNMALQEKKPVVLILNRSPAKSKFIEELEALADAAGIPMAQARLGNRPAYATAISKGLGVNESAKTNKASEELAALAIEIEQMMEVEFSVQKTAAA